MVTRLKDAVEAASRLQEPVRHILLRGPAGLGKTTLAEAVAAEAGAGFQRTSGPAVKDIETLVDLLISLRDRDVFFIDEIHRLPANVPEMLYEAMAECCLSLPDQSGGRTRTRQVRLCPFTLIGATTHHHLLTDSLRGRFEIAEHLDFYSREELMELLRRAAADVGLGIEEGAARRLASVSRDTPRTALALFGSAREQAVLRERSTIDEGLVERMLEKLQIDERGLVPIERQCLEVLRKAGRPLGRCTLAERLGVSPEELTVDERYLSRLGLLDVTAAGRVLSR